MHHSQEWKEKMRKIMTGRIHTWGHKISASMKGKKFSKKHCEKLKIAFSKMTGSKNNFYGHKHSAETKQKMREKKFKGIRKIGGYKYIYTPKHPFAHKSGYVAESRLIAEKYIGKILPMGHIVHHIDKNLLNNAPENLYVFESIGSHISYHRKKKPLLMSNLNNYS
jgi:hypothetical protein